jgi:hypothetical protein
MPEVAISTSEIEGVSLRIEKGLQHMLEHVLKEHSVIRPLSMSSFEGDITYLGSNGQKGNQHNALHCMLYQ